MNLMNCPRCQGPLSVNEGVAVCDACGARFKLQTKASPPGPSKQTQIAKQQTAATPDNSLASTNFTYFTGQPSSQKNKSFANQEAPTWSELSDPMGYLADPGLIDAVNVSLLLGQPLLLTGEAGTGKTQLAFCLAAELGFDEPLKFETKSTSESKDLFYSYDALARLQAAQTGSGSQRTEDYVRLNALGLAILRANPPHRYPELLSANPSSSNSRRSIVLIDEVDKAPRDFPNDILGEIEGMYFRIPELNNLTVRADPAYRPVVVMTSNSEKNLPDAFLRRCIFYNIPFPTPERIREILVARLSWLRSGDASFLEDALQFFYLLRKSTGRLEKKPSTAELLAWVLALRQRVPSDPNPLRANKEIIAGTLCTLAKTTADQQVAMAILDNWLTTRKG